MGIWHRMVVDTCWRLTRSSMVYGRSQHSIHRSSRHHGSMVSMLGRRGQSTRTAEMRGGLSASPGSCIGMPKSAATAGDVAVSPSAAAAGLGARAPAPTVARAVAADTREGRMTVALAAARYSNSALTGLWSDVSVWKHASYSRGVSAASPVLPHQSTRSVHEGVRRFSDVSYSEDPTSNLYVGLRRRSTCPGDGGGAWGRGELKEGDGDNSDRARAGR